VCNKNIEKYWEDEWGNKCVFSHHDSKSAGVCVMFKKGLDFVIHNSEIDRNDNGCVFTFGPIKYICPLF
jgi:hypothetical protein